MDKSNLRVQVMVNGNWENILPQSIKRSDVFRVINPDGSLMVFGDGSTKQFALDDAYVSKQGKVSVAYGAFIHF